MRGSRRSWVHARGLRGPGCSWAHARVVRRPRCRWSMRWALRGARCGGRKARVVRGSRYNGRGGRGCHGRRCRWRIAWRGAGSSRIQAVAKQREGEDARSRPPIPFISNRALPLRYGKACIIASAKGCPCNNVFPFNILIKVCVKHGGTSFRTLGEGRKGNARDLQHPCPGGRNKRQEQPEQKHGM